MNGAHIHRNEFRAQKSSLNLSLEIPMLVIQSISPIYLNNPSYTILDIV